MASPSSSAESTTIEQFRFSSGCGEVGAMNTMGATGGLFSMAMVGEDSVSPSPYALYGVTSTWTRSPRVVLP